MKDKSRLFIGAALQWGLATAFTRYAVLDGYLGVALTVFCGQSLWWANIQHTTKDGDWPRWLAWCLGASFGAVIGKAMVLR